MMKKYLSNAITLLEHHKEHYIDVKIFGETRHLCSRCTGQYLVGIPAFFIIMSLYIFGYSFDFSTIFLLSWILAGATILDWVSVEILHIRQGNNKTRMVTGGTLGIGASMYFWLLPSSWDFKIVSLMFYSFIMSMIIFMVYCKKQDINPLHEIYHNIMKLYDIIENPRMIFVTCTACPICGAACCPCCAGGTTCCPCLCCCCSCGILAMICMLFSGKGCGSCGKLGGKGGCSSCGCGSCGNLGSCGQPKK